MCVCVIYIINYFFLSVATDVLKSVPDKLKVLELLADISSSWKTIGIVLGVDDNTLDSMDRRNDSDTINLNNVIKIWKSTKSSPDTWESLISAIKGPVVNKKSKAEEIYVYIASLSH